MDSWERADSLLIERSQSVWMLVTERKGALLFAGGTACFVLAVLINLLVQP